MGASGGGIPRASGLFGPYYEYKESENSIRTSIRRHIPPLGNSRGGAFFITSSGHLSPFAFQRNITLHISKEAPPSHADACNVRRVCVFTSNLNLNAQNSDYTICLMSKKNSVFVFVFFYFTLDCYTFKDTHKISYRQP